MSTRYDGTPPWDRWRLEMERWLSVARQTGERTLEAVSNGALGRSVWPAIDIMEEGDSVEVRCDVPGVPLSEIQVSLVGQLLTIAAERPPVAPAEAIRFSERPSGSLSRTFPLPMPIDPERVEARLRDGVLTIVLKKPAQQAARVIPIRASDDEVTSSPV